MTGIVFNIQRYTIHDGPGIRTEIFMKGCPLRCKWCSNPESFKPIREVAVYRDKCIGLDECGFCKKGCPKVKEGALVYKDGFISAVDRDICIGCMKCAARCPADALKSWGDVMSVDDIMEPILADRSFYEKSGGGVTFSGGEPMMQPEFLKAALEECRRQGIHTCVESALLCKRETLDMILPLCDFFITDIKAMDDEVHKKYTGQSNKVILENIKYVASKNIPLIIRIPVIPGVNDNDENMDATADFILNELNNRPVQIQLLRFKKLGEEKYKTIGLEYRMTDTNVEREAFEEVIKGFVRKMQSRGIPAAAGSSTPVGQKQEL